jgi:hypothetical protein
MSVTRLVVIAAGAAGAVYVYKRRRRRPVPEVSAGSRPIEGVGTSTAAFVGLAERSAEEESAAAQEAQ